MSVDAIERTEFPAGHAVFFGLNGKIIMTPQSEEHSETIKRVQYHSILSLGIDAKTVSDVYIDFPADENSAPDFAVLREDAQHVPNARGADSRRYSFEDLLLVAEVVSTSSVRKDYDECTLKYGRYGIPIYLVVDPYRREIVLHTEPTGKGYAQSLTRQYGSGKLPVPLADGRTYVLDLDELQFSR